MADYESMVNSNRPSRTPRTTTCAYRMRVGFTLAFVDCTLRFGSKTNVGSKNSNGFGGALPNCFHRPAVVCGYGVSEFTFVYLFPYNTMPRHHMKLPACCYSLVSWLSKK